MGATAMKVPQPTLPCKSQIFIDDEVIGFGVQVRETGRKSFTLDYMFEDGRWLHAIIAAICIHRDQRAVLL
jgi:hypothetical protein